MHESDIATVILDEAFKIHRHYGPGVFERVYEAALESQLKKRGLKVDRQRIVEISDIFVTQEPAFIVDLFVEDKVIVELKSVEVIKNIHKKQLLTYLRLSDCRLGLLLNFNESLLKNGIWRIANNLE